jgi:prepilin-type N-terminal cleavage/methylation domain-containing protein
LSGRGFTLVEALIAIGIIVIVAAIPRRQQWE